MLYDGFIGNGDRALCERVLSSSRRHWRHRPFLEDRRLPELLFRFRARNFPDTLSEDETAQWHEHCREQIARGPFTLQQFEIELAEERARPEVTSDACGAG